VASIIDIIGTLANHRLLQHPITARPLLSRQAPAIKPLRPPVRGHPHQTLHRRHLQGRQPFKQPLLLRPRRRARSAPTRWTKKPDTLVRGIDQTARRLGSSPIRSIPRAAGFLVLSHTLDGRIRRGVPCVSRQYPPRQTDRRARSWSIRRPRCTRCIGRGGLPTEAPRSERCRCRAARPDAD
jgi:hypothetical protein